MKSLVLQSSFDLKVKLVFSTDRRSKLDVIFTHSVEGREFCHKTQQTI